jgi:hypothetical protein
MPEHGPPVDAAFTRVVSAAGGAASVGWGPEKVTGTAVVKCTEEMDRKPIRWKGWIQVDRLGMEVEQMEDGRDVR